MDEGEKPEPGRPCPRCWAPMSAAESADGNNFCAKCGPRERVTAELAEIAARPWVAAWSVEGTMYDDAIVVGATREEVIAAFRADPPEQGGYDFDKDAPKESFEVFQRRAPRPVWELIGFDENDAVGLFERLSEVYPEEYSVAEDASGDDMDFLPMPDCRRLFAHEAARKMHNEREAPKWAKWRELSARIDEAMVACVRAWCEENGYISTRWIVDGREERVPFEAEEGA